jgi:hypothetical protein
MNIEFAFEAQHRELNFISCTDENRFIPCPFTTRVLRHASLRQYFTNIDISNYKKCNFEDAQGKYVIGVGVAQSPEEWCGAPYLSQRQIKRECLFSFLNERYLEDMKTGKAILVIDQSHEGYQSEWLWDWFHQAMSKFSLPSGSVIYVTGNLLANNQYQTWCKTLGVVSKVKVIPHTHFEHMIFETGFNRRRFENNPLPTLEDQLKYKTDNLGKIKDYNFLQKRLRSHRMWGFKQFHDSGVLGFGLINMNPFNHINTWMEGTCISESHVEVLNRHLPMFVNEPNNVKDDGYYITRFTDDIMLDSWISVVSEASFADGDNTCFISEKTFKPIMCYHPFMIWGNKNSLHYIREMGYKTFHPFIDETYDTLNTWERMVAITDSLHKFHKVEDKLEWYKSVSDILEHNREVLRKNSRDILPEAYLTFEKHVGDYFNA